MEKKVFTLSPAMLYELARLNLLTRDETENGSSGNRQTISAE